MQLYSPIGRPSIPPEKLLRAMLLQAFYSIRSERQLMERLDYDLLFRWFVGLVDRRADLGSVGVLEEPGPVAGGRHRQRSSWRRCCRGRGSSDFCRRSLLGRWHADRGLGLDEELQAEGRLGGAAGAAGATASGLPWREALERNPCLDHRSGGQALPQGQWQGGQARLHRATC